MTKLRIEMFGGTPVRFVTDFAGDEWVNLQDLRKAHE